MLGVIILLILLGTELAFMVYCLKTKNYQEDKKNIIRLVLFVLFVALSLVNVIQMSFRWNLLFVILLIKALMGVWYFLRKDKKKEKIYNKKHVIMSFIGSSMLIIFAVFPAIIFPQFQPIERTGEYEVETISYTLTDPNRKETFSAQDENRKVSIQFWYPAEVNEKYPLVVFSHGAFGFRGSNVSTFENLASNGYVVCSIDHTYQAFFTKQTDGKMVIADMEFINNAMAAQNGDFDEQTTYEMSQEWLKLRLGDVNLVLNDIIENTKKANPEDIYKLIDPEKIGVTGHSLGGATAAALGRERAEVDAVIVIDGTMFGEEIGFENGTTKLNDTPYPIPLLNIYGEEHLEEALQIAEQYPNISATTNAIDARQMMVKGSGHLNFTDLPMFSPFLANMLGTGEVDSRYCIETMNQVILDYFNHYLKDTQELNLQTEY